MRTTLKLIPAIALGLILALARVVPAAAADDPAAMIDETVTQLFDEFSASREQLEGDRQALFDMVDRIAGPAFDFDYISKLVLAKSWKGASEQQRNAFALEFKRLMIVTYATALFRYTGNETMTFGETKVREKKGVELATVDTKVRINAGEPIPVKYFLLREKGSDWKIYNLEVGDLNMVLNYRSVVQSTVLSEGMDGTIASMKAKNDESYN